VTKQGVLDSRFEIALGNRSLKGFCLIVKEMPSALDEAEKLGFRPTRVCRLEIRKRTELVSRALDKRFRFGCGREKTEVTPGRTRGYGNDRPDAIVSRARSQGDGGAKREPAQQDRSSWIELTDKTDRAGCVGILSRPTGPLAGALPHPTKVEPQNRDTLLEESFTGTINHLVVKGAAKLRMGMAKNRNRFWIFLDTAEQDPLEVSNVGGDVNLAYSTTSRYRAVMV
jgi:hypothetical protein